MAAISVWFSQLNAPTSRFAFAPPGGPGSKDWAKSVSAASSGFQFYRRQFTAVLCACFFSRCFCVELALSNFFSLGEESSRCCIFFLPHFPLCCPGDLPLGD